MIRLVVLDNVMDSEKAFTQEIKQQIMENYAQKYTPKSILLQENQPVRANEIEIKLENVEQD